MDIFHGFGARDGLDAAHAGGHGALGYDVEQADGAGGRRVRTAAELYAVAVADYTHDVAVFLAEQGHGAHGLGLFHGGVTLLHEREVGADELVHADFHVAQLLVGHLLEVGEVEAEVVRSHEGTLLLHVGAQYHAQGLVQQVGAGMVVLDVASAGVVHHQVEGLVAHGR